MLGHDLVQPLSNLENFSRMNVDLGGLPLKTTQRLMDHDTRIGQGKSLPLCPRREQERSRAGGLSQTDGVNGRLDVLHRVVNAQPGRDATAGRVDIQIDIFLWVLSL